MPWLGLFLSTLLQLSLVHFSKTLVDISVCNLLSSKKEDHHLAVINFNIYFCHNLIFNMLFKDVIKDIGILVSRFILEQEYGLLTLCIYTLNDSL